MGMVNATPQELRKIGEAMNTLRMELMRHATQGAHQAGFESKDALGMAIMMVLIGAAQRFALTDRQYYVVFKAICGDMAASEADAVVTRAMGDMGPEVTEGGVAPPSADDLKKIIN